MRAYIYVSGCEICWVCLLTLVHASLLPVMGDLLGTVYSSTRIQQNLPRRSVAICVLNSGYFLQCLCSGCCDAELQFLFLVLVSLVALFLVCCCVHGLSCLILCTSSLSSSRFSFSRIPCVCVFGDPEQAANRISSPHVMHFHGFVRDPVRGLGFVMPRMQGSLQELLCPSSSGRSGSKEFVTPDCSQRVLFAHLAGMSVMALHEMGICHRDIKAHNFLYDGGVCRL